MRGGAPDVGKGREMRHDNGGVGGEDNARDVKRERDVNTMREGWNRGVRERGRQTHHADMFFILHSTCRGDRSPKSRPTSSSKQPQFELHEAHACMG